MTPRYIPIEQVKVILPTSVGVKEKVYVSFGCKFLIIPSEGILNAEAQLYASLLTNVRVTGSPFLTIITVGK